AFVVDEVEFHITSPADLLPRTVCFGIRKFFPEPDNRKISVQETIPDSGNKSVPILNRHFFGRLAVIEEQAAYAAGFSPVSIPEIFITFLLVIPVEGRVMFIAYLCTDPVKMYGIFIEQVIRGKVLPGSEPLVPDVTVLVIHFKIAPVGMYGRNKRIFRVK